MLGIIIEKILNRTLAIKATEKKKKLQFKIVRTRRRASAEGLIGLENINATSLYWWILRDNMSATYSMIEKTIPRLVQISSNLSEK